MGDRLGILRADGTLFFFCHPFFQWVGSFLFQGLETEPNPFANWSRLTMQWIGGNTFRFATLCTLMAIGKGCVEQNNFFPLSGKLVGSLGNKHKG